MKNQAFRSLNIKPSTIDEENRSVEVVWTSGASVRRFDMRGEYNEVLVVSNDAVDLERLNAGAPVLNTHRSYGLEDILGVVESAWLANGKGYARVRFSDRPEADAVWRDVVAGIIRNLSVGYEINGFEEIVDDAGERTLRVNSWTPVELSVVPVPADAGAQFRSAEATNTSDEAHEEEITTPEAVEPEAPADDVETVATPDASEPVVEPEAEAEDGSNEETEETSEEVSDVPVDSAAPAIELDSAVRVASNYASVVRMCIQHGVPQMAPEFIEARLSLEEVQARVASMSEIRSLCKRANKAALADDFIQQNASVDEVRKALLDAMLDEDTKTDVRSRFAQNEADGKEKDMRLSPTSIYSNMNLKRGR